MEKRSTFRFLPLLFIAAMMGNSSFGGGSKLNRVGSGFSINPMYIPRRKKLKGWQKEAMRKKHYNKFS